MSEIGNRWKTEGMKTECPGNPMMANLGDKMEKNNNEMPLHVQ